MLGVIITAASAVIGMWAIVYGSNYDRTSYFAAGSAIIVFGTMLGLTLATPGCNPRTMGEAAFEYACR